MQKNGTVMLDSGGDSVVLVSTIPSPFIVADDLQRSGSSVAGLPPSAAAESAPSPDDCSEITSTVADEPTTGAPVKSPSAAASPSPPPAESTTAAARRDARPSTCTATHAQTATASPSVATSEMFQAVITSTSVTTTTTTTTSRQKQSLEMVVNRLKRPSTTSSSAPTVSAVSQSASPSLPVVGAPVTLTSVVPTSGHVVQNGGGGGTTDHDDSVSLSLLQRLVAVPSPAYTQLPVVPPTSSHFRFRSVAAGSSLMPAAVRTESGPPIKQLKHMCKNCLLYTSPSPRD